jgi:hypothetical protein
MEEEDESTLREVMEAATGSGLGEIAANMAKDMQAEHDRLQLIKDDFATKAQAVLAEQEQQKRFAAQARAAMEADRVAREQATLEAIHAIRETAEASAKSSAEREKASTAREDRMVRMTDTLVKVTWVLAALTLVTTVLALADRL